MAHQTGEMAGGGVDSHKIQTYRRVTKNDAIIVGILCITGLQQAILVYIIPLLCCYVIPLTGEILCIIRRITGPTATVLVGI